MVNHRDSAGEASHRSARTAPRIAAVGVAGWFAICAVGPHLLLFLLSLGSGWSYPHLLPDRLDARPWRSLGSERDQLARAMAVSATLAVTVGLTATSIGFLAGRAISRTTQRHATPLALSFWRFITYLPYVASPIIVGVTLYDLWVRCGLAGTFLGVALAQSLFASAFAAVFFSTAWSAREERLAHLVRELGGGPADVWRHATWPRLKGLATVCFLQTSLFSWTDYGFAALIGGGQVDTVTTRLFAYIREASVNQGALAALALLIPALISCAVITFTRITRTLFTRDPTSGVELYEKAAARFQEGERESRNAR
ncbi:MAG: hypothetical protein U1A77_23405 [Pirellulales bacterium]